MYMYEYIYEYVYLYMPGSEYNDSSKTVTWIIRKFIGSTSHHIYIYIYIHIYIYIYIHIYIYI